MFHATFLTQTIVVSCARQLRWCFLADANNGIKKHRLLGLSVLGLVETLSDKLGSKIRNEQFSCVMSVKLLLLGLLLLQQLWRLDTIMKRSCVKDSLSICSLLLYSFCEQIIRRGYFRIVSMAGFLNGSPAKWKLSVLIIDWSIIENKYTVADSVSVRHRDMESKNSNSIILHRGFGDTNLINRNQWKYCGYAQKPHCHIGNVYTYVYIIKDLMQTMYTINALYTVGAFERQILTMVDFPLARLTMDGRKFIPL